MVKALGGEEYLALECGVSVETVRAWLTGEQRPSPANARRLVLIATSLGLTFIQEEPSTGVRRRRPPS
jgi:hypothetical protein